MGLDIQATRFLLRAAKSGVRFSRTATLGRQNLSLKPAVLIADARRVGLSQLTDDIEAIYAAPPLRRRTAAPVGRG